MKKRSPAKRTSRAVAADLVGEWLSTGAFPDALMELVAADRAFVMEMVYGVARWKRTLEWIVHRCTERKPEGAVTPYLLVGLYQIFLMDSITEYAAVSETVEAAKAEGRRAAGFVNAVLRKALRELKALRQGLEQQKPGIRESHPDVLVDRWTRQFGPEKALELCRWNNTRPQVTVHPYGGREAVARFLSGLTTAGVAAAPHPFAPDQFVSLPPGTRVTDLPGFAEGLFGVQDPSTIVAIDLLDPRPGEFILDACAAPGGKTALIAERMQGRGELVATDLREERLEPLRENVKRLRLDIVRVARGDAASEMDVGALRGSRRFDRILLDVPCTNTGVLRRRPDARWRFALSQLGDVAKIQCALLDNAGRFLKPGGRLVYSTCSLEPDEDENRVREWVALHPRFALVKDVRLFPPETKTDGVYAAAIELRHDRQDHHQ